MENETKSFIAGTAIISAGVILLFAIAVISQLFFNVWVIAQCTQI
ncbi:hypothetical protein LCGC14_1071740 [marine sediment metagenome]|uniref:Uncharacterized protein n=1 Tax=marine sediment metagenome TaxID=412755 RepID=A0A0F9MMY6_9ZZZZ